MKTIERMYQRHGKYMVCSNCKWWSKKPIPTSPPTTERLCLKSKVVGFGAYGQDGKAIITAPDFACKEYEPNGRSEPQRENENKIGRAHV